MREVVIDRARWRSGGAVYNSSKDKYVTPPGGSGLGNTKLLNEQGYMCCLGFACLQLADLPEGAIRNEATPASLNRVLPWLTEEYSSGLDDCSAVRNTPLSCHAVDINDNTRLSRSDRERQLATCFKDNDIQLTFVGEYEDAQV